MSRYPDRTHYINLLWLVGVLVAPSASCRKPEPPAAATSESNQEPVVDSESNPDSATVPPHPRIESLPIRVDIPVMGDDTDRWLVVEAVKPGAPGAWATGSFDPARNKLTIKTSEVQRFAIDARIVKIDWSKPVVLSIDGIVTELRRRTHPLYRLALDPYGKWVVDEHE